MRWLPKRSKTLASLADEFVETYVSWREACDEVRAAYERWGSTGTPQRGVAFEIYCAALEREEHAAHTHSDSIDRLRGRLALRGAR